MKYIRAWFSLKTKGKIQVQILEVYPVSL
ncbi:hypothetical protein NC653_026559 [Populus alba x Populus x berolinensis]|uniref:Uncharacterized protein n=1 Tax=Populus alba x Populus x berolinensis TaxID=444605 RepID=A0AAD6QAG0_9ROSI|nr:hypothetical protein NC653_026559 [Populus alba x Populus x berolinensis]